MVANPTARSCDGGLVGTGLPGHDYRGRHPGALQLCERQKWAGCELQPSCTGDRQSWGRYGKWTTVYGTIVIDHVTAGVNIHHVTAGVNIHHVTAGETSSGAVCTICAAGTRYPTARSCDGGLVGTGLPVHDYRGRHPGALQLCERQKWAGCGLQPSCPGDRCQEDSKWFRGDTGGALQV